MSRIPIIFIAIVIFTSGCSLGGDFTPPPALATSQAAQPIAKPTLPPQPTPVSTDMDPLERKDELEQGELEDTIELGDIRGQIVNGSEGGELPDAIEVTLYGFDNQQEAFSKTTVADENGEYQFTDLENQSGRVFITTVDYQGALYASNAVQFIGDSELDLPITIFETTSDLTELQLDRIHVIVDLFSEGVLQVTELWILSNLGDRTIASESGDGILEVELPNEAVNLDFESGMLGSRFQVTADGFIDLSPIRPGMASHEVIFSFNLPLEESTIFSQPISYPVEAVILLSREGILTLSGEGVVDLGVRQMTGTTLHTYSMDPISSGGVLEFMVERELGTGMSSEGSGDGIGIAIGVAVLAAALGGTGLWLYRRRKEAKVESDEYRWAEETTKDLEELDDREAILQAMADLDDAYEAGELEGASYWERRHNLKNHLLGILQKVEN